MNEAILGILRQQITEFTSARADRLREQSTKRQHSDLPTPSEDHWKAWAANEAEKLLPFAIEVSGEHDDQAPLTESQLSTASMRASLSGAKANTARLAANLYRIRPERRQIAEEMVTIFQRANAAREPLSADAAAITEADLQHVSTELAQDLHDLAARMKARSVRPTDQD